ncbi:hypothetical protein GCM10009332_10660 [Shewanella gelidii]|uniref:Uncharacterized protein n=2 Tax=Shewanella gelidii TaxID=1642821 RepID=A0A917JM82_9GAMM|nr:hypothetical protein GCM10009332_10660 [Shewanella gelidii]
MDIMNKKHYNFSSFVFASLILGIQGCGGGAGSQDDIQVSQTEYSFSPLYVNLLSAANSSHDDPMVDVYYQQGSNESYQIVENLRYLQSVNTYSFGWTGLPQANATFTTRDALNNQALLTTSNLTLNGNQTDYFLLLTGAIEQANSIRVQRLLKQQGEDPTVRFYHANPFYDGPLDIYNVTTQQRIVSNLARYQASAAIRFDQNVAQTPVIMVPAGVSPDYTNTSGYLFQHTYDTPTTQHLYVLTSNQPSNWQNVSLRD